MNDREKLLQIISILDDKLSNNDILIIPEILSYLSLRCELCYNICFDLKEGYVPNYPNTVPLLVCNKQVCSRYAKKYNCCGKYF